MDQDQRIALKEICVPDSASSAPQRDSSHCYNSLLLRC